MKILLYIFMVDWNKFLLPFVSLGKACPYVTIRIYTRERTQTLFGTIWLESRFLLTYLCKHTYIRESVLCNRDVHIRVPVCAQGGARGQTGCVDKLLARLRTPPHTHKADHK